ncbi:2-amino-4-hydroxy-6-hydroxymethyldihydropteridine diphosphokinase [Tengunoibacter tsumagoiensis]|uniref:2-amino-4-hydroxy-6-hydroxymethyldihydropteridine diphosphokinase n=1 Tax=Tengunoibacter tsumagoiensis TaxID=2014871 RepID=A0A402A1V4_9CHLR|nr:2-amino-4-hydroxy-6-hydroxymethyldihydropteridine diphosphokinase [Tengunoibacter tsumagoiensis]GCE13029.1 hypothetical protein KTT_28880 [Tengunoibacter tsumagoiensis]
MSTQPSPTPTNTTQGQIVYLALGSNQGDRKALLTQALLRIQQTVAIDAISAVYETDPVGYLDQPRFLNLACRGMTELPPLELLKALKLIETELGRIPTFRNAPRLIDIDILLYGDLSMTTEQLIIPHPRMWERAFVLAPLVEIEPGLVDPLTGRSAEECLTILSQKGMTRQDQLILPQPESTQDLS